MACIFQNSRLLEKVTLAQIPGWPSFGRFVRIILFPPKTQFRFFPETPKFPGDWKIECISRTTVIEAQFLFPIGLHMSDTDENLGNDFMWLHFWFLRRPLVDHGIEGKSESVSSGVSKPRWKITLFYYPHYYHICTLEFLLKLQFSVFLVLSSERARERLRESLSDSRQV